MFKTGFYPFLTYDDVLLIGLVGLILVLRNWWDLIRYGLQRSALGQTFPVPPRPTRIPHRRHPVPKAIRPAHRPGTHHA